MNLLKTKCLACNLENCLSSIDDDNKIFFCTKCETIFAKNKITNITMNENPSSTLKTKFIIKISEINTSFYIDYLKQKTNFEFKTALDIGTRYGTFVKQLNNKNIDAYGVELNKNLLKYAVTKKIFWKQFDSNFQIQEKFDLICLSSMIFYVRDNMSLLKQARRLLNKNGLMFIVTINPSSSLTKNNLLRITEANSQMIYSKKIFESLENNLHLKLIDYTPYISNLYNELDSSKNRFFTFLKYYFNFKKPFSENPNGNQSFVLLSNISKD